MAKADLARTGSTIRCAIYTRKSSDEGLEQEFNSLDAQREACEAYIVSQRHAGWVALADMYDDGGLSGGTMERPALLARLEKCQKLGSFFDLNRRGAGTQTKWGWLAEPREPWFMMSPKLVCRPSEISYLGTHRKASCD